MDATFLLPPAFSSGEVHHRLRRHFWCAFSRQEVEVEFEVRGLPGFRYPVAVVSCPAWDPPTAIGCRRPCRHAAFRRQWPWALPVRR